MFRAHQTQQTIADWDHDANHDRFVTKRSSGQYDPSRVITSVAPSPINTHKETEKADRAAQKAAVRRVKKSLAKIDALLASLDQPAPSVIVIPEAGMAPPFYVAVRRPLLYVPHLGG